MLVMEFAFQFNKFIVSIASNRKRVKKNQWLQKAKIIE